MTAPVHLVDTGLNAIGEPDIAQPFRIAIMVLAAAGGLALALAGLGLTGEERRWLAARRQASIRAEPNNLPEPETRPARAPVVAPAQPRGPLIADRASPRESVRRRTGNKPSSR